MNGFVCPLLCRSIQRHDGEMFATADEIDLDRELIAWRAARQNILDFSRENSPLWGPRSNRVILMIRSRMSVDVAGFLPKSSRDSGVVVASFCVISTRRQRLLDDEALRFLTLVSSICSSCSAGDRRQRLTCLARHVSVGLHP